MQVSSIQNNNPNFGHSFRVSISLKGEDGIVRFVNPSEDHKLYKTLNSKIINWLNEDYYSNLRQLYGKQRRVSKTSTQSSKPQEMVEKLKEIDDDYAKFNVVRSVYRRNKLAYAASGADVSIIENLKGAKEMGIAKADSLWTYGHSHSDYVKAIWKAVRNNVVDYVRHDNVLLRSPRNKEIMLKATFKPAGKNTTGTIRYDLDDFEFHENVTKRTLAPVNPAYAVFKKSQGMLAEIKRTIQYHVNKILGYNTHFSDLDSVLYPKTKEIPHEKVTKTPFVRKEPKQLELKFED